MLKVIEKFSRVDANTVLYQFTVDDPGTWVKPWSGQYTMTKVDGPIYEYACNGGIRHGKQSQRRSIAPGRRE